MKSLPCLILILFLFPLETLAKGFDGFKIRSLAASLASKRAEIFSESRFGDRRIYFYDSLKNDGFVLVPFPSNNEHIFEIHSLSAKEAAECKQVLSQDSLYSLQSWSNGDIELVIQLCHSCVQKKLSVVPSGVFTESIVGEEYLVSLAFHEHMHAFEQKQWTQNICSLDDAIKVQEGTAMLAEAKAFSLLVAGRPHSIAKEYIELFASAFPSDPVGLSVYIEPARVLLNRELFTGLDSIGMISRGEACIADFF